MRLLGISGSVRKESLNAALLRAAGEVVPPGTAWDTASIADIPLYNGDVEAGQGIPEPVSLLKDRIAASDGLLIATPEYNNSIPGVLKNAIDWASRPPSDIGRVFHGKPVALIGASPGGFGTILAQNGWLPVFRTLGMQHWTGGRLLVSRADKLIREGTVADEALRDQLRTFVAAFVEFLGRGRSANA